MHPYLILNVNYEILKIMKSNDEISYFIISPVSDFKAYRCTSHAAFGKN